MTHFLVTGAASGIGKHLVGALSRRGESVLAADLDLAGLERAAASDRWSEKVKLQQLDVRSATEWEVALGKALEHFGTLEVLLNVAGVLKPGNCWQVEVKDIDLQLDVNAKGVGWWGATSWPTRRVTW
jgi:NADP-dependent 3-hydroxy acid dehydrogenase YdfG